VLFPDAGIAEWLEQRRPLLWQSLSEQHQAFNDGNAVGMLLDLPHSPDGLTPKGKNLPADQSAFT
jgi:hypothetical protein